MKKFIFKTSHPNLHKEHCSFSAAVSHVASCRWLLNSSFLHNSFSFMPHNTLFPLTVPIVSYASSLATCPLTLNPSSRVSPLTTRGRRKPGQDVCAHQNCTGYHHLREGRDRLKLDGTNTTIPEESLSCLNWGLKLYGSVCNFSVTQDALIAQNVQHFSSNSQFRQREVSQVHNWHQLIPRLNTTHCQKSLRLLLSSN